MWQCYIISELRTVWQISNPIPKELEAHDFSCVSVHDVFWNTESIGRVLKSKKAAKVIAMAIAEFATCNGEIQSSMIKWKGMIL